MADGTNIDKGFLYGNFQRQDDRRNRLAMRAAHKALDMAEEDMNINVRKSGVGTLGLIGTALAAGLPTAGLAAFLALKGGGTVPTPPTTQPPSMQAPAGYELQKWDGKQWLPVPADEAKP